MISVLDQAAFIARELEKLGRNIGFADLAPMAAELEGTPALKSAIEAKVAPVDFFRTKHWDSIVRLGLYRHAQYALVRALKPKAVIETGVLHGLSTLFPLSALERNALDGRDGRMISIDAPSTFEDGPSNQDGFVDTLPPGLGPGWIIPDNLGKRWTLQIGTSQSHLAGAIGEVGDVGFFIHDSEHSETTMLFEFETVWPHLEDGAVLLADNIDVNTAFFDFARDKKRMPHVLPVDPDHRIPGASGIRCGILRK